MENVIDSESFIKYIRVNYENKQGQSHIFGSLIHNLSKEEKNKAVDYFDQHGLLLSFNFNNSFSITKKN